MLWLFTAPFKEMRNRCEWFPCATRTPNGLLGAPIQNFVSMYYLLGTCYEFVNLRMPQSRSTSPGSDTDFETTFIFSLAVYTKGSGKKAKETKSIKVKEFDFTVSEDNYLEFVCEFLKSQSQDKYQVTAKKCYSFKYLYPPSKAYVACGCHDMTRSHWI